jgi:hypothetical protein
MVTNSANAQNTTTATANNQTQAGQLSFFLKLADGSNQTAAQTQDPSNLKNITINVNVQQGQEPPKKLPITALVPKATTLEQLELCGSVGDQPEQCQPLSGESISLDLTGGQQQQAQSNASTSATAQPQSYSSSFETFKFTNVAFDSNNDNYGFSSAVYSPNDAYFVPVQLIDDVNVNVPIDIDVTAIIPINIEIENAQICANLGGTQTCQINNINPTTNEYSPTTIDLASQEPAVTTQPTTAPTATTTAPTTSTTEPAPTTAPTTTESTPSTATEPTTTTTEPTTSTTEPTGEESTAEEPTGEEPSTTEATESETSDSESTQSSN